MDVLVSQCWVSCGRAPNVSGCVLERWAGRAAGGGVGRASSELVPERIFGTELQICERKTRGAMENSAA
eukprot:4325197-Pyramimonas_sp.AAC.1